MIAELYTVLCNNCVVITNFDKVNSQGNSIYKVEVIVDYKTTEFFTLSGRAHTQSLDRNVANKEAPSPNGYYTIGNLTDGYSYETGGVFLPYEPDFQTERSHLGFHIEPSWGLDNGEDGTEGCHAFETLEEFNAFYNIIKKYNINKLLIISN